MVNHDVDEFLAKCDDVIDDWEGSPDSASWSADGSQQYDTVGDSYYLDRARSDQRPRNSSPARVPWPPSSMATDYRNYLPDGRWRGYGPLPWTPSLPGNYDPHFEGYPIARMFEQAMDRPPYLVAMCVRPFRWDDADLTSDDPRRPTFTDLCRHTFTIRRASDGYRVWPVLVDQDGRCIGPPPSDRYCRPVP